MSRILKDIFHANKPAKRQDKRQRRAMRFELLEKRILPSANVLVPPVQALFAPQDPQLLSPFHVQSAMQAQQKAQTAFALAFKGASAAAGGSYQPGVYPASSSYAKPDTGNWRQTYTTASAAGSGTTAPSTQSQGVQIVFVDPTVNDYSQLVNNLIQSAKQSGTSVTLINLDQTGSGQSSSAGNPSTGGASGQGLVIVTLNPLENGVDQITQTLSQFKNVSAVDILSHGSAGLITVGTTQLNEGDLSQYASEISQWKTSLSPNADIVLYGCDVAGSGQGIQFVQQLAALTGANVAAATQDVGSAAEGGTWTLGYSTGTIAGSALLSSSVTAGYPDLLTDYVTSSPNMNLTGTSGNDRFIFENNWGSDTVTDSGTGGTNVLDFSAVTANLTFTVYANGTVSVTDGTNTLAATANIQELIGGSGNNTFVFESGATFNGTIVGGSGGTNALDYSAYAADVTVNLATGAATGTHGVTGINNVVISENGNKDTVTYSGGVDNFSTLSDALTMTVNADGTVSTTDGANTIIAAASTSEIIGGSGANTVVFDSGASFGGKIDAGSGTDNTLDYSAYAAGITANLATGAATGIAGGVSGIQNVIGGAGANVFTADGNSDTFTGQGGGDTFNISSNNWGAVTINEPDSPSASTVVNTLNLSGVSDNLAVTINADGSVSVADSSNANNTIVWTDYANSST
ncbi:MAG: DUF4347 domain-containing protein, partial [Terracidiphilus sp.]